MTDFKSPSLYIDLSRLPPPDVIEEIEYEVLLRNYKTRVVRKLPTLAKAVALEQSPTNVTLQTQAQGELIVRERINAAARAVMLPFAKGADLDNLAALFGVSRLTGETDDQLRRRAQLAPEAFSTAGSEGAYMFQALSSDVTIRDVSAIRIDNLGGVKVTVMNSGADPTPTDAQLAAVRTRLLDQMVKPLTDVVQVAAPLVKQTKILAEVTLYPGPDAALVVADIGKALLKVRDRISILGRDLTRAAIISACYQEGVENVTLISPEADITAAPDECIQITSAAVTPNPVRVS